MKLTIELSEEELERLNELIGNVNHTDREDVKYAIHKLIELA
jgi:predicted DNA-binding protein